ncbi:DDE_Tnp_1-associated [Vibrio sp. B1ASS3]|nr:DDE_Tnp_1-associated [Vibrio sp. B1ASS3]CAE6964696.1 DDE_Tnp_1-associated [Vibrio sp. B1ASS3]
MFLVISAIEPGCEGWQDIEFYGEEKLDWLRKYKPFKHGIPRRHTIARILCSVVAESLLDWINEQRTTQSKPIIAFDGKVLRSPYRNNRNTALQLVTAYDTERGLKPKAD